MTERGGAPTSEPVRRQEEQEKEQEEEGWSRSALADCRGCPGLTPSTAVRTPVLPLLPPPPPSQLILMLLFLPSNSLSLPVLQGSLPCLLHSRSYTPATFDVCFPSPLSLDPHLGGITVAVRNAETFNPPPTSPCGGIHSCLPPLLLLSASFSYQGKPRKHYTRAIHAAVLALELYVPTSPMLNF